MNTFIIGLKIFYLSSNLIFSRYSKGLYLLPLSHKNYHKFIWIILQMLGCFFLRFCLVFASFSSSRLCFFNWYFLEVFAERLLLVWLTSVFFFHVQKTRFVWLHRNSHMVFLFYYSFAKSLSKFQWTPHRF